MNVLKKIFHKHEAIKSSCPFTENTYTVCKECGKHLAQPVRTQNG